VKRPKLPEGRLLHCPTKGCSGLMYAFLTPTGEVLAACMACKYSLSVERQVESFGVTEDAGGRKP
jgi:hypothetical protein